MGFVMNDVEEYKESRGFYIDNLANSLPGPILSSVDQIVEFVKNPYVVENEVSYNDFFDNKSSERICKTLNILQ